MLRPMEPSRPLSSFSGRLSPAVAGARCSASGRLSRATPSAPLSERPSASTCFALTAPPACHWTPLFAFLARRLDREACGFAARLPGQTDKLTDFAYRRKVGKREPKLNCKLICQIGPNGRPASQPAPAPLAGRARGLAGRPTGEPLIGGPNLRAAARLDGRRFVLINSRNPNGEPSCQRKPLLAPRFGFKGEFRRNRDL